VSSAQQNTDRDWTALDARYVWHPYTQHATAPLPVPIVRAEGARLHTADGRVLLDAISSWWVTLHGHANPVIAQAIADQARTLDQVIFAGCTHEPAARLAAELVALLPPGLTRVFLSDDGSTAVEVAVKTAFQFWSNRGQRRPLIAALEHAYHGDTFGAMRVSARGVFTAPFDEHLGEVARLPDPTEGDTVGAFRTLIDQRGPELAALIVEPLLMGAGGMRMWPEHVLRALAECCSKARILLIADEVLTGFGRTGPLFACARAGIAPDILCVSKGITGGMLPLGATATTEKVFDGFRSTDKRHTLFHGHSYTANPISCAAARASLTLLDNSSAQRRENIEHAHREHMARLAAHPRVRNPRILGTVAAFDLAGEAGYLSPVGGELASFALRNGVLLRPMGNVVYVLPPYCTTADDLAMIYRVIERFLEWR
jgi:adenosylmethionine-8-amino-7-oxononanoate aminotransferase